MWYHFEKFVQGHLSAETFRELEDNLADLEVKDLAEDWSEHVNDDGGRWAGWTTQWRKVESPPDDWVLKQMLHHAQQERYHREKLMEFCEIDQPPVTKYGVSYFDDQLKERIQIEDTFLNESDAQKKCDELKAKHRQEYIDTKGKVHKYLEKLVTIRSIKYLEDE